jgi:hypothetical protein
VDTHPLTIYSAAAIQELNRKLEEKNAALEREITELKALMKSLAQKVNGGAQ